MGEGMPKNRSEVSFPMQDKKLPISYNVVIRNAAINLVGRALPMLVALLAIPIIIRGLGLEEYGILSLVLVVVTYFSLFDFGLGGATTKFVAAALGKGEQARLPSLIWTSIVLISLLGMLAGLLMALGTPLLVGHFLNISPGLRGKARSAFYIMSVALPFMLTGSAFQGTLEAKQRYDLVNVVNIPSGTINYVLSACAAYFHSGLVPVVCLLAIVRMGTCTAFFLLALREHPTLKHSFVVSLAGSRPVLVFGGWLALSNLSWPILLYMDRFAIGALLSAAILPFYSAPSDLATRLWVLPSSWESLYPAYSAVGEERQEELASLCARGFKHLALIMGPIVIFVFFFGNQILRLWLGRPFELASTGVLKILAIGVYINSLSSVPDRLIKGIGRSDIIAKLHLGELPVYGLMLWGCVVRWGLLGAAAAWALRAALEAVIVFAISWSLVPANRSAFLRARLTRLAVLLAALAAGMWVAQILFAGIGHLIMATLLFGAWGVLMWNYVLDQTERRSLRSALNLTGEGT
jgi:O-antigen/teichoic acid export membrane protein